jgi:hypothetical protein
MQKLRPAIQDSNGRSKPWAGAHLVNAFSEMADGDKAAQFAIMAIPGLVPFATATGSGVRGLHRMGNTLYGVVGTTLYSFASDGTPTALGTINGGLPVRMADNGTEIAIRGGTFDDQGYVYSAGVVNTGIANLPPVSDVTYIDGYFVWTIEGGDQFIISGLNDGLTYNLLDVATVEGSPDALVGLINDHRELLFFGTDTTEIWYNSGDADFPFTRQGNAFIERGCADKNSIQKADNSVFFIGNDLILYRLNGYDPQRLSTHAVEYHLAKAAWYRSFVYTQEGHKFCIVNTDLGSFGYDVATGTWHERKSFGYSNYRVSCAETAYGNTIMGNAYAGKLYTPNLEIYTEDGDTIPVVIEIPDLSKDRERMNLYAFEVYCETGVGNADDDDPQIILQYSRDGSRNWSNEVWRSLGAVGEYLTRAVWRLNIEFRQLAIRLQMPSKTRRFVIDYFADIR